MRSKLFIYLLIFSALTASLVSCQREEKLSGTGIPSDVTLSVSIPGGIQVKSAENPGDGTLVNRCILEVYEDGTIVGERHYADINDFGAEFAIRLVTGHTYDFVFWADCAEGNASEGFSDIYYNTADGLTDITLISGQYSNSNDELDAFFGSFEKRIDDGGALNFTLRRPFGQVNLYTMDINALPAGTDLSGAVAKISYAEVPAGFNALEKTISSERTVITPAGYADVNFPAVGLAPEDGARISFDYIFASPEEEETLVNFTLELEQNGQELCADYQASNIPVRQNYRTNVRGNFLTKAVDITVDIIPGFDKDYEFEIEEPEIITEDLTLESIAIPVATESGISVNYTYSYTGTETIVESGIGYRVSGSEDPYTYVASAPVASQTAVSDTDSLSTGTVILTGLDSETEYEFVCYFVFEGSDEKVESEPRYFTTGEISEPEPEGPVAVSIAEFLAASVDTVSWYQLTGVIANISNTTYGNLTIEDETGEIYIYGLTAAKVGSNDRSFSSIGLEVGDTLTLATLRSEYNDQPQGGGDIPAYYISHKDGQGSGEPEPGPGDLITATIEEFIAAEVNTTTWYRLTGTITEIQNTTYGNIVIEDETGEILIYGLTKEGPVSSNDRSFSSIGLEVGDTVTLATLRGEYNGNPQGGGNPNPAYYISHKDGQGSGEPEPGPGDLITATIEEFIAAEVNTTTWYRLTGTITEIQNTTYGNIVIEDETGEILIYGLTKEGPVSSNDKSFSSIGLEVGDTVTLATLRGEYNGNPQGGGNPNPAYYISHEEGGESGEGDEPENQNLIIGTEGEGIYTGNIDLSQPSAIDTDEKWAANTFIVDGQEYTGMKLGTSSEEGSYSFYLGKTGSATLTMYAIAWNNAQTHAKVMITGGGTINGFTEVELDCQANTGLANNAPFTITFGPKDFYTLNIEGATDETVITVTTEGMSKARVGFLGVNVR